VLKEKGPGSYNNNSTMQSTLHGPGDQPRGYSALLVDPEGPKMSRNFYKFKELQQQQQERQNRLQ
tara:strand:- start:218 stop:412 length:195 start_codon:yes stop_codon:yes gene_type:complete